MNQIKIMYAIIVIITSTIFIFGVVPTIKINAISYFKQNVIIHIDKGFFDQRILDISLENLNTKVFKNDSHVDSPELSRNANLDNSINAALGDKLQLCVTKFYTKEFTCEYRYAKGADPVSAVEFNINMINAHR